MGHQLEIDRESGVSRMLYFDEVTDEELASVGKQTPALVEAFAPKAVILDFSSVVKFRVTSRFVTSLAHLPGPVPEGIMTMVVAPGDFTYGMARMFEILRNSPNLHVVRTVEEAYSVLEISNPTFVPLELP